MPVFPGCQANFRLATNPFSCLSRCHMCYSSCPGSVRSFAVYSPLYVGLLRERESNPRPLDYETNELPLLPSRNLFVVCCSLFVVSS